MKNKLNTYLAALAMAAVVLGGSTAFASPNREGQVRFAKRSAAKPVSLAFMTGQNMNTGDGDSNSRVAEGLRSYRPRP
jgi:hypothetical protein